MHRDSYSGGCKRAVEHSTFEVEGHFNDGRDVVLVDHGWLTQVPLVEAVVQVVMVFIR